MTPLKFLLLFIIVSLTACSSNHRRDECKDLHEKFTQYSVSVQDTFHISIQLPKQYHAAPEKKFPVLIFIDGNFYFPIMSSIVHQYETAGLLKPAIVIGIGYKSFQLMDSLRVRDYLFPKALPSDEINATGGGQAFHHYLTKELLPKIDAAFRTDITDRTLLGHSFGGYFVLYTLLHQADTQTNDFRNFVSASPTLWYHDFYLNKLPEQLAYNTDKLAVFVSVGDLEDSTWSVNPVKRLTAELQNQNINGLQIDRKIFSQLDHMDVPVLAFTKALRELDQNK